MKFALSIVLLAVFADLASGLTDEEKQKEADATLASARRPKVGYSPRSSVFVDREKIRQSGQYVKMQREEGREESHPYFDPEKPYRAQGHLFSDWEMVRDFHQPVPEVRAFTEQGGSGSDILKSDNERFDPRSAPVNIGGGGSGSGSDVNGDTVNGGTKEPLGPGESPEWWKRTISKDFFGIPGGPLDNSEDPWSFTEDFVSKLDLPVKAQISQMAQYDIQLFLREDDPTRLDEEKLVAYIVEERVGSLFNSASATNTTSVVGVEEWRSRMETIYRLSTTWGNKIPILYALDSVHGVNYIYNATLFPHQLGMAATFDDDLVEYIGKTTGVESRYAGVPWDFSPILGIGVQPSWPRVYETFGEDPLLCSRMGVAIIQGLQAPAEDWMNPPKRVRCPNVTHAPPTPSPPADTPRPTIPFLTDEKADDASFLEKFASLSASASDAPNAQCPDGPIPLVAACMKHYVGYTNSRTGHDRTPVHIPWNILLDNYMPSFDAAAMAGVLSVMEAYTELNGRPVVSSNFLLNYTLRQIISYPGTMVTDYNEIFNQVDFHHAYANYTGAILAALHGTTIDMAMYGLGGPFPNVSDVLPKYLAGNDKVDDQTSVQFDAVKDSTNRVLNLKHKLGLFDGSPVWTPVDGKCAFGCPEHRGIALGSVHSSITLLQNNLSTLPLDYTQLTNKTRPQPKIAVIGPACDSVPIMSGGWTMQWQGTFNKTNFAYGSTVVEVLKAELAPVAKITFFEGCPISEGADCAPETIKQAADLALSSDITILCLGENPYAEKPGDIDDLTLPGKQIQMVQAIHDAVPERAASSIITVLIQGRPRILGPIPKLVGPILFAYLPGPSGGQGIVDVLLGSVWPTGKLPITYPKTVGNGPQQYDRKFSANGPKDYNVQWSFGYGLGYGSGIEYKKLEMIENKAGWFIVNVTLHYNSTFTFPIDSADGSASDPSKRNPFSTNRNNMPGDESAATNNVGLDHTVLLFAHQEYRRMPDSVSKLRDYRKKYMWPGATRVVQLTFNAKDFQYYDEVNCRELEAGLVRLWVGVNVENPRTVNVTTGEILSGHPEPGIALLSTGDEQQMWRGFLQSPSMMQPYHYDKTCDLWSSYYRAHAFVRFPGINGGSKGEIARKPAQFSEFMVSSIVCFGAGVVGTFILVQWLMLRRRRKEQSISESEAEEYITGGHASSSRHSGGEGVVYGSNRPSHRSRGNQGHQAPSIPSSDQLLPLGSNGERSSNSSGSAGSTPQSLGGGPVVNNNGYGSAENGYALDHEHLAFPRHRSVG